MCAITGLISRDGYFEEGREIYGMADMMFHRGPDAQGFASYGDNLIRPFRKGDCVPPSKVLLGFDRLSIRDISTNGMQPMISGDRKVAVVFNGEI